VVRSGEVETSAEEVIEFLPEMAGEARITVRDDNRGKAKVAKDVVEEDVSIGRSVDMTGGRHENDVFREAVNEGDDSIMAARRGR
jgi:hypothetical protein